MKISAWNATLLTTLLIAAPAASRAAGQQPPPPPAAPAPPDPAAAPPAPEAAPAPPAPPSAHRRSKKIIVASPDNEKQIVVDGDGVFISGDDDDADRMADVEGFEGPDGRPFAWKMNVNGGGGFIGIRPIEMTPELRQHFGAPKDSGILVGSVEPDGPAAKAGLKVGDIVTRIDGDPIESSREMVRLVRHKKGGQTITLELLRDKASKRLTVTVAERKDREIRIGELPMGDWPREWSRDWSRDWNWPPRAPEAEAPRDLEKRLDDLEKKLKQLEGRLPSR